MQVGGRCRQTGEEKRQEGFFFPKQGNPECYESLA